MSKEELETHCREHIESARKRYVPPASKTKQSDPNSGTTKIDAAQLQAQSALDMIEEMKKRMME